MTTKQSEKEAMKRYNRGEQYSTSTSIDEDTILAGYGQLGYTEFEFPLPNSIIVQIYGTNSWRQWFFNKGLHQYLTINRRDKIESVSPYWTEEEFEKHKKLNPNSTFEKL